MHLMHALISGRCRVIVASRCASLRPRQRCGQGVSWPHRPPGAVLSPDAGVPEAGLVRCWITRPHQQEFLRISIITGAKFLTEPATTEKLRRNFRTMCYIYYSAHVWRFSFDDHMNDLYDGSPNIIGTLLIYLFSIDP